MGNLGVGGSESRLNVKEEEEEEEEDLVNYPVCQDPGETDHGEHAELLQSHHELLLLRA